jgi:WD40 repeat protein
MRVAIMLSASVGSVEFSPDGQHLLSGSGARSDPIVQVWDAASGKLITAVTQENKRGMFDLVATPGWSAVHAVYSPNGRRLLSSGVSSSVRVLDSHTGATIAALQGPADLVRRGSGGAPISWHPDGTRIAVSWGVNLQIWDAISNRLVIVLRPNDVANPLFAGNRCLVFSHNGERLASGSEDGTVRVWNTHSAYSY